MSSAFNINDEVVNDYDSHSCFNAKMDNCDFDVLMQQSFFNRDDYGDDSEGGDEFMKSTSSYLISQQNSKEDSGNGNKNGLIKSKREIYLEKNRESAKKCRDKKRKEVLAISKENANLHKRLQEINRKIDTLCPKCKSKFRPYSLYQEKPLETQTNTNSNADSDSNTNPINKDLTGPFIVSSNTTPAIRRSSRSNKRFTVLAGAIGLLCVFSTLLSIESRLFYSSTNPPKIRSLKENQIDTFCHFDTVNSKTNLIDKSPDGPYVLFGDYYSIRTQNAFLSKKYNIINNGKKRIVKDIDVAMTNMTTCDDCLVEIQEKHIYKDSKDPIQFKLFIPFFVIERDASEKVNGNVNETQLFYEVDCMVMGFKQNEYFP